MKQRTNLNLEQLEARDCPATTFTWMGAGAWEDATHWSNNGGLLNAYPGDGNRPDDIPCSMAP